MARLANSGVWTGGSPAQPENPFEAVCDRFLASVLEQTGGPDFEPDTIDPALDTRIKRMLELASRVWLNGLPTTDPWAIHSNRLIYLIPILQPVFPLFHMISVPREDGKSSALHENAIRNAKNILGDRFHIYPATSFPSMSDADFSAFLGGLSLSNTRSTPSDEWIIQPKETAPPGVTSAARSLERGLVAPLPCDQSVPSYDRWIKSFEPLRWQTAIGDAAFETALEQMAIIVVPDADYETVPPCVTALASQRVSQNVVLVGRDLLAEADWLGPVITSAPKSLGTELVNWLTTDSEIMGRDWFVFINSHVRPCEIFLEVLANAIVRNTNALLVHGDYDIQRMDGHRENPVFKGGQWDEDLFLQSDLFGGWFAVNRSVLLRLARQPLLKSMSLYELGLLASEDVKSDRILHIPHVLSHLPPPPPAIDTEAEQMLEGARQRALSRRGWKATMEPGATPGDTHVRFSIPVPSPKVSVIIPTRDGGKWLAQCLGGVLSGTDYSEIEVIVIDNGSRDSVTLECLGKLSTDPRARVIRHDHPFNFSEIMNLAVREATGTLVCMLNDDVRVLHRGWLKEMVGLALRPDVGIVGALLLFEDGTIQHAGVTLGLLGHVAGHDFHYEPESRLRQHHRYGLVHQTSAVTAACAVFRREVYGSVGGMDQDYLAVNYNDLDLCLKIGDRGLNVLWTPYARLVHAESKTRGKENMSTKMALSTAEGGFIAAKWGDKLQRDPFWNDNLSYGTPGLDLSFIPPNQVGSSVAEQPLDKQFLLVAAREIARTAGILPDVLSFHAAKVAHHLGRDDMAAILTLEAVSLAPEAYTANLVAGTCFLKIGNLERAAMFYRNANLISPHAIRPWLYRGFIAERLGHREEARDMLSVALRYDPHNSRALAIMERLSGDIEGTVEIT